MNKNEIYIIKNRIGEASPKVFTLDEAVTLYDGLDRSIVVIDQANNIGHGIATHNSQYKTKGVNDIKVTSFNLDAIVAISAFMGNEETMVFLDRLVADGVIDATQLDKIKDNLRI